METSLGKCHCNGDVSLQGDQYICVKCSAEVELVCAFCNNECLLNQNNRFPNFCASCGKRFQARRSKTKCRNCGEIFELNKTPRFCYECGKRVQEKIGVPSTVVSAEQQGTTNFPTNQAPQVTVPPPINPTTAVNGRRTQNHKEHQNTPESDNMSMVQREIKECAYRTDGTLDEARLPDDFRKTLTRSLISLVPNTEGKTSLLTERTIRFLLACVKKDRLTLKNSIKHTEFFSEERSVFIKNTSLKRDLQEVKELDRDDGSHDKINPITRKTSDSSNDFPEEDESETSHSRLCNFYDDMRRSFVGVQPFSYYFVSDFELVVHTETPCLDKHSLKTRLLEVLKRCGMPNVEVSIKSYSAGAQFCSGPCVGNSVFVKPSSETGKKQKLGMYLQYDDCIYWLSTAHAVIQVLHCERTLNLNEPIGHSYITRIHIEKQRMRVSFNRTQRLPTPYLCFSFEKCEYSDKQTCLHSVDIMVGPVPFTADDLLCNANSRAVTDDMRLAGFRYDEEGTKFKCYSKGIKFYKHSDNGSGPLFDVKTALQDKFVYTTLEHEKPMVLGKIFNARFGNGLVITVLPPESGPETLNMVPPPNLEASNVMFIESRSDDVTPQEGDSGSVWFIPEGEHARHEKHYNAVAVTIGIATSYVTDNRPVWIATPLCAALFGLSKKYPAIFPNYDKFKAAY